jgi:hypothetical protein
VDEISHNAILQYPHLLIWAEKNMIRESIQIEHSRFALFVQQGNQATRIRGFPCLSLSAMDVEIRRQMF